MPDPNNHPPSWREVFGDEALVKNYFEIYSEPHRRYPTIAYWPRYVIHTATYFDTEGAEPEQRTSARKRFLCWLKHNFNPVTGERRESWRRRVANTTKSSNGEGHSEFLYEKFDEFLESFVNYVPTQAASDNQANNPRTGSHLREILFFEATPCAFNQPNNNYVAPNAKHRQLIARVEVHEFYFTLTLFVPLATDNTHYLHINNINYASIPRSEQGSNFLERCYDDIPSALVNEVEVPEFARQIKELYRTLQSEFKASTFVNFHGAILPHNLVSPSETSGKEKSTSTDTNTKRLFAEAHSPGLNSQRSMQAATEFLEVHGDLFAHSVFAGRFLDVVACYVANGHAIYISNIGSQPRIKHSPRVNQGLRFLVIYEPPGEGEDSTGQPRLRRIQRWVLSRLLYRLLTMGTLRLHTMRNLGQLLEFNRALASIEHRLVSDFGADGSIDHEREIVDAVKLAGINIFAQIQSAKLSYDSMSRLLGDLGVVPIPGRQSYDAFIRRRLDTTYARIANLGEYYKSIWSIYLAKQQAETSKQQELETKATGVLQVIATAFASASITALLQEPLINNLFIPYLKEAVNDWGIANFSSDNLLILLVNIVLLGTLFSLGYDWAIMQKNVVANGKGRTSEDQEN